MESGSVVGSSPINEASPKEGMLRRGREAPAVMLVVELEEGSVGGAVGRWCDGVRANAGVTALGSNVILPLWERLGDD